MKEYEFWYLVQIKGIEAENHEASMECTVDIYVTVDGERHYAVRRQWDRTTEWDKENRTITHWGPDLDPNGEQEEWDPDE